MREQDDFCAFLRQLPDGWKDPFYAGRVRDFRAVHRNVQVNADKDALAARVTKIVESFECHLEHL
ncbi:hypothetical protein GCM10009077_15960 [Roseibium denhamense]